MSFIYSFFFDDRTAMNFSSIARAFVPFVGRQSTQVFHRMSPTIACRGAFSAFSTYRNNIFLPFSFTQSSRSYHFGKSGSHYEITTMVNAKNPDLPEDPALADIACRIFGTSPISNPHARSVRKVLMKPLIGEAVASYYPKYPRHNKLGFSDPFRVRAEAKLERLRRRGKGPPKKGQGKRAQKKK
jgi:small subunit ribosomal protein S33